MDYSRMTSHPFDMNEYFSGLRFSIGGRDYEKEDREEFEKLREEKITKIDTNPGRGIKEILRSIHRE